MYMCVIEVKEHGRKEYKILWTPQRGEKEETEEGNLEGDWPWVGYK